MIRKGKPELEENPAAVPLRPPRIPFEAVRFESWSPWWDASKRVTARAMARVI